MSSEVRSPTLWTSAERVAALEDELVVQHRMCGHCSKNLCADLKQAQQLVSSQGQAASTNETSSRTDNAARSAMAERFVV